MELDKVSAEDLKPLLNKRIHIQFTNDVKMSAQITGLTEFNSYSPLERKPFSVVFRTEQKSEYYNQGIFGVILPSEEKISIFLTPQGFDGVGMRYEAVFS